MKPVDVKDNAYIDLKKKELAIEILNLKLAIM